MGSTNYGTQTIHWRYSQPLIASDINEWLYDILTPGVYDGGTLSIDSGNDILVAPLSVLVETSTNQLVKVKTSTSVELTLAVATPYVTCQLVWVDSTTNYMDFTVKAVGDIASNDIVIGMGVYAGVTLSSFDYTDKTLGFFDALKAYTDSKCP